MEIRLLRLLWDYSRNGKLVDIDYIDKLIEIIVNEKQLDKYIKNSRILDKKESNTGISLATYLPDSKIINIYANGIYEMLEHNNKYLVLFNDAEQLFYKNLLITQVILHELEHANQKKIIDTEQSLEAQILRLSMNENFSNIRKLMIEKGYSLEQIRSYIKTKNRQRKLNYENNYTMVPEERLAEIKSYQEIMQVLSHIKEYTPNLLEFEQTNELENLLRGFDYKDGFLQSPTIFYLVENGDSQFLNRFDWYDEDYSKCLKLSKLNYSLQDRLKYGLMIDDNEFNYCTEILQSSKKYNC